MPSLGLVNPLHLLFFYTLILSVLSFYVCAMFWCFHLLFSQLLFVPSLLSSLPHIY